MRPRLITAENARRRRRGRPGGYRFNEAAAHHRGERPVDALPLVGQVASMRPRLITAENSGEALDALIGSYASMRPRLITAENSPAR